MQINLDGKLLGALTRIFDVIVATLLFALCCLPVVTIGASLSAVYATMLSIAETLLRKQSSHGSAEVRSHPHQGI